MLVAAAATTGPDYRIALIGLSGVLVGALISVAGALISAVVEGRRSHRKELRDLFHDILERGNNYLVSEDDLNFVSQRAKSLETRSEAAKAAYEALPEGHPDRPELVDAYVKVVKETTEAYIETTTRTDNAKVSLLAVNKTLAALSVLVDEATARIVRVYALTTIEDTQWKPRFHLAVTAITAVAGVRLRDRIAARRKLREDKKKIEGILSMSDAGRPTRIAPTSG